VADLMGTWPTQGCGETAQQRGDQYICMIYEQLHLFVCNLSPLLATRLRPKMDIEQHYQSIS
jgi:hypothetical protein